MAGAKRSGRVSARCLNLEQHSARIADFLARGDSACVPISHACAKNLYTMSAV